MRWLLGRDPGDCATCGAGLERGASWCGGCGARTDAATSEEDGATSQGPGDVDAVAEADDGAAPPHDGLRGRRVAWVLVLLVLGGLVVAQVVRDAPARPLLGAVGAPAGMSASGPPPAGLGVAWEHELPQPGADFGGTFRGTPPEMAATGDRIRLGDRVVDRDTGRLVRVGSDAGPTGGVTRAEVVGGELVVVETMTGDVVTRAPLAAAASEVFEGDSRASARSGAVSLFAPGPEQVVLLGDDGELVAHVEGYPIIWLDRAVDSPAAFPLRPHDGFRGGGDPPAEVTLVSAVDGAELGSWDAGGQLVVEVVGDVALVAATDEQLGRPGDGASWDVRVVDARTGDQRDRLGLVSAEVPRLLGTFDDGTVAIGTRQGREVTVLGVPEAGATRRLAQVQAARTGDALYNQDSSVRETAAMTGDRLLVLSGDSEHVAALDATGVVAWGQQAPGVTSLAAGDDHVALLSDDPVRPTRVLRAVDGEAVVTVPPTTPTWFGAGDLPWAPVAVLSGHVGIGEASHFGPLRASLGSTLWLDVTTGETRPVGELFERYLAPTGAGSGHSWVLHGTAPTTSTGASSSALFPVLSRDRGGAVRQLLDPDEGPRTFTLELPDEGAVASFHAEVIGVSAQRLAVYSQGFENAEDTATHLLDRTTGAVTVVPGVIGFGLSEDVLVGLRGAARLGRGGGSLVGIDPATGEQRWERPLDDPSRLWGRRALVDDELLVAMHGLGVTATALDDGREAWVHDADAELTHVGALGASHVVVATTDGTVVVLDRTDGTARWRTPVGAPISSLTAAGDDVLVGTVDGVVVHLDADGGEVQRIAIGTGAVASVAALGDTVVAVADDVVTGLRVGGTGITQRDEVDLP